MNKRKKLMLIKTQSHQVISGSNCKVQFVDYGNTSVVKEVYDITPEQIAHPPQAIRTSIKLVS